MAHVFDIRIELSDDEYQTVGRAAGGAALLFQERSMPIDWTVEQELITLLRRAIADERTSQQSRDNIATLLRYGAAPSAVYQPEPAWLEPAGEVIGIMPNDPRDLNELGMQCPHCGRSHDVSGRTSGEKAWCPCGASILIIHRARVVAEGGR